MKHLLLTVALTLLLVTPLTAETLSFQPKPGSEHTQTQTMTMQLGIDMAGQAMNIDMEVSHRMRFTVMAVTDSLIDLEARYDSLSVKLEMPNLSQVHHSGQTEPGDLMTSMLLAIKDKPFNIVMTKQGRIHAIKNLEAIMAAIDKLAEQADPQQAQMFKQQIQGQFGEAAIKENMLTLSGIFPAKPVNKGDSWQSSNTRTTGNLPLLVEDTHTLKDVTDTHFIIETVSQVRKNTTVQGAGPNMNITGSDSKVTTLDKATGWLVASKGETSLEATVDENDPNSGGMALKMSIKASHVLTGK